ncbi:Helix-turn-helix domain protein [compost metagenome]
MWLQKNSLAEIAGIRKLTQQTVSNHFAKLIQTGMVSISDILPEDKIRELAKAFDGYDEESLNGLKEKYGNKFTWDELKLFKASL